MLFKALKKLIDKQGLTDELKGKLDVFHTAGRISEAEYKELMGVE